MVSGLTRVYSTAHAGAAEHGGEHQRLRVASARPCAVARRAVRAMRASISLLDQAVDGERRAGQQPDADGARRAARASRGRPRCARNMPITAQNTISCATRGLVSAQYWAMRLAVRGLCVCGLTLSWRLADARRRLAARLELILAL